MNKVLLVSLAVVLALSVGLVSCGGGAQYKLTMAVSPSGSGTATDLTNASPYAAGTVISIKAVAAAGYTFVSWTALAGTFANPNAATTNFTMPTQDVTVTANFAPLDHFKCYLVEVVEPIMEVVYLEDQFGAINATVGYAWGFANPAEKEHGGNVTPISNPDHHLTLYNLDYEATNQTWLVEVDNQFGTQNLTVQGPCRLAVPTQKVVPEDHEPPVGLDHFSLYEVIEGPPIQVVVGLKDQFVWETAVFVYKPVLFANPVRKTHGSTVTEIVNPEAHLVFYEIVGSGVAYQQVQVVNQFGGQSLNVSAPSCLAVPSEKLYYEPIP